VVRALTVFSCVAWLALAGALPGLHVHESQDHEHREHRHGPAFHSHPRNHVANLPADGHSPIRIGPCDPAHHAVLLSAAIVTASGSPTLFIAPAVQGGPAAGDALERTTPLRDLRAHSPPRLTDGPLRAPPASLPA
jgi:hypothetical protein